MKIEKLSAWAELISSVAIVVTLVYLTIQVRQNTAALNAQSRQSVLASAQAEILATLDHPEVPRAITKPGPLTAEDNIKLDAFLGMAMRSREFSWLQYRSGLIDGDQWQTEKTVLGVILSTPRTRLWWNKLGRNQFSKVFASFVDNQIKAPPIEDAWTAVTDWSDQ